MRRKFETFRNPCPLRRRVEPKWTAFMAGTLESPGSGGLLRCNKVLGSSQQRLYEASNRSGAGIAWATEAYDPRTRHRPGEELAGPGCTLGVRSYKNQFWKWLKIKGENASSSRDVSEDSFIDFEHVLTAVDTILVT